MLAHRSKSSSWSMSPEDELVSTVGIALAICHAWPPVREAQGPRHGRQEHSDRWRATPFDDVATFLRVVDELTPLHVCVLWHVAHPDTLAATRMRSEPRTRAEALEALSLSYGHSTGMGGTTRWRELYNRSLVVQRASGLDVEPRPPGPAARHEFLRERRRRLDAEARALVGRIRSKIGPGLTVVLDL
jgi:hypothetical protein